MREWTFTDTMLVIASLLLLLNICTFGLPRYHFYKMRKYNEKLKKLKESEYKGYKTELERTYRFRYDEVQRRINWRFAYSAKKYIYI